MPSERVQVLLELVAGQYKREAREAATATGRIGQAAGTASGSVQGMGRQMGLLRGALSALGVTAIAGQFRDMANAAMEDAEAQEILANALRTNVGATDAQITSNERWISSMQLATRTADNDLRQALTDLTVVGRGLEDAQNDIAIATDIAASRGIELGGVIRGLVRAQASGSTAGLARLGIETKNAAGEMLTYDEVLQNAARTMGGTAARAAGTLAGALERGRIVMQEAREEAGDNLAPALVTLSDAWNEFFTMISGGNHQLAHLQSTFNQIITSGIDPFADAVASAGFVLSEFTNDFGETIDTSTFETLVMMLGLTNEQVLQLRHNFTQNGASVVKNKDDLDALIAVLDGYVAASDPAVWWSRRFREEQERTAEATEDTTEALEAQRDLFREMTDPIFALISAEERLNDAQASYNQLIADGVTAGDDFSDAISDLIRAQADYEFAQREANIVGFEGLGMLQEYAAQAGISTTAFNIWAQSIRDAGTAIGRLPPMPTTSGVRRGTVTGPFHSGGVVPGPPGSEQLALVQAGEMIVPANQTASWADMSASSNVMAVSSNFMAPSSIGPTIIVNNPISLGLPRDLQLASLLANVATLPH